MNRQLPICAVSCGTWNDLCVDVIVYGEKTNQTQYLFVCVLLFLCFVLDTCNSAVGCESQGCGIEKQMLSALYILFSDVIGVCKSVDDISRLTTKSNREVSKRTLSLMDMSGKVVTVTLWGEEVSMDLTKSTKCVIERVSRLFK